MVNKVFWLFFLFQFSWFSFLSSGVFITGSACFLYTCVFFPTHGQINSTYVLNLEVFFFF